MKKDFFNEPFDDGTKTKLTLYKNYLEEWFPVFIKSGKFEINIFDFFSGPGLNKFGEKGSPIITIGVISSYFSEILSQNIKVNLFFFDKEKKYCEMLLSNIEKLEIPEKIINIKVEEIEFQKAFKTSLQKMRGSANLVFLDQFGVKFITKEIFQKLSQLPFTDILFFISSSIFKRFSQEASIQKVLGISNEDVLNKPFLHMHRFVLGKYRTFIPRNRTYYLAPFSIKKGANVYGLIFGSNSLLGMEKFLKVSWKVNKLTGDANFDIDDDNINLKQPSLFEEFNKSTKLQAFEKELEDNILSKSLKTDKDVYIFTITNGFLGTYHAKPVLMKLKNKKIKFSRVALAYSTVMDKKRNPTLIQLI